MTLFEKPPSGGGVTDREIHEARIKRGLSRLSARHKRELREQLGDPPDVRNVPIEWWKEVRKEQQAQMTALLLLMAIPVADDLLSQFGMELDDRQRRNVERAVKKRTNWVSERMRVTSRRQVQRSLAHGRTALQTANAVFGAARLERVAITEATLATTAGTIGALEQYRDETNGAGVAIWRLDPCCDHCTVCPMLADTPDTFWRAIAAMPVHVHCRCFTDFYPGTVREARAEGLIRKRNPARRTVLREIRKRKLRVTRI